MMSFKSAVLAFGMLAAAAGMAQATDPIDEVPADTYQAMGMYLRGDIGWSWLTNNNRDDSDFTFGGGAGYQYDDNLRGDIRIDWAGNYDTRSNNDAIGVTTVLGNFYFDIPNDTMLTPYLGAGAGYGWKSFDGGRDKDGFAIALMAGASVDLMDGVSLDVEYRFREVMVNGKDPMEHQILTGLRYKF
jgi:opacity protein-like surface antigen